MDIAIEGLLKRQDELITRKQALDFMTQAELTARLGRSWQIILPGVYATFTGPLTPRHIWRAALLHAGAGSQLNDLDALRAHGLDYLPADPFTRVLIADRVQISSRDFVAVRRTTRLPKPVVVAGMPTAPVARALCEFAARHGDEREAFAVVAGAVQAGRVTFEFLVHEIQRGPTRGRPRLLRMVEKLRAGVRSAPEDDFRRLVLSSRLLPEPLWNALLRLPDGRRISPDALFVGSGVVHETNGRRFHSGYEDFDSMQERNDALVAAGLTVLHNPPGRIREHGRDVLAQVEQCHVRHDGGGLPEGVVLLRSGPPRNDAPSLRLTR